MSNIETIKEKSITITKYWSHQEYDSNSGKQSFKEIAKKIINEAFLNKFGLTVIRQISTYRPEQKSYSLDPEILEIRNQKLANMLSTYFADYGLDFDLDHLLVLIERYERIFRSGKISDLNGGMGFNNGLVLFCITAFLNPKCLIESGVWRGYTTLLLEEAVSDDSTILCFDINLDRKEFDSKKASYYECDLTSVPDVDMAKVDFAFFDDHVSHYDRLLFCLENGIDTIVLDDDVGLTQVHGDGWPPIPTASMIYDYDNIPHNFHWVTNGYSAKANIDGIDVHEIVKRYDRVPFPSLSHLTGYKDSSFTSMLIKKKE